MEGHVATWLPNMVRHVRRLKTRPLITPPPLKGPGDQASQHLTLAIMAERAPSLAAMTH